LQRRTALLTALAALATCLAGPATADAANKCRAQAERGKVLAQSTTALVYSRGSESALNRYVQACTFKDQKTFRLPGQDGGDTEHFETVRLSGRYVAYVLVDSEPASNQDQSEVWVVDLKSRKKVTDEYAGLAPESDSSASVVALVLNSSGTAAWITQGTGEVEDVSVHAAARGGHAVVLDRGKDIARRSLALSADGSLVYWTRGAQVKSAAAPKP
jgi:hypothetical protein